MPLANYPTRYTFLLSHHAAIYTNVLEKAARPVLDSHRVALLLLVTSLLAC